MAKSLISTDDLARLKALGDPQFSPDGRRILFTFKVADVHKNKYWSHLWLCDLTAGTTRQFTFGEVSDAWPRWSGDGTNVAFIRTREKVTQLWLVPAEGGEARPLTQHLEGSFADPVWSPDGAAIAFSFRPTHPDWTREAAKKREETGKSTPPRVIERARYREDGAGFQDECQGIWVCEVETGRTWPVTGGPYNASAPAWSPGGKWIAFISNRSRNPDRLLYRDDIWRVPFRGGRPLRVATPVGPKSALAWSPDGKKIAYIGSAVGRDRWRPQHDRLWVVSVPGGKARCLTLEYDRTVGNTTLADTRDVSPTRPLWTKDGRSLFVPVSDSGSCHCYRVDAASGRMTALTQGPLDISGASIDATGRRVALVLSTAAAPTELYLGTRRGNKLRLERLTDCNAPWLESVTVSEPEEFWITQPDGARIQGWVLRPPRFSQSKKYPLLVYVHGGPHAQYGNTFFHEMQVHAANGYVVVYANPRGSNGRDEEFLSCIHRDWGNLDYQDVMAVADYGATLAYVDHRRTAIAGGSYGGYMTNWVVGHTNLFRCAVTDRCVSNFVSMVATTDMTAPPGSYWPGNPWGKDFEEGWKMSPLKYVANVHTPMLVIHSEGDLRCPIEQAEQWYMALKWLGQEVVLVRYPRETSHGLSRGGPIDLRFDRLRRIGEWLDNHLKRRKRGRELPHTLTSQVGI